MTSLWVHLLDLLLCNSLLTLLPKSHSFLLLLCSLSFLSHCCHVSFQSALSMGKKGFSLLTACTSSLRVFCFFFCCASLCVSLCTWPSTPHYSFQGWDCVMCGTSALPVEHEGTTADMRWYFLRASARRPVCHFHTAARVGSQERHHHWLCRWHHTGEVNNVIVTVWMRVSSIPM